MSAAACSAIPLTAWLYVSRVTVTDAWPRRSACSPRSRGAWRCWANTGPISLSSHGVMWRFLAASSSSDGAFSDHFEQAWEGSIPFLGTPAATDYGGVPKRAKSAVALVDLPSKRTFGLRQGRSSEDCGHPLYFLLTPTTPTTYDHVDAVVQGVEDASRSSGNPIGRAS